ncbi:MAG: protoheme IX farnesyltransferase [Acidimicrobiales bacterium]|nr:protoheme IX farnesyltransferase [Acidimicrobiales bacterium]
MLATAPTRSRASAFIALTKPRIIELLLVSTVPAMIVANDGLPSLWLILATVAGGTLSAGGANAINMYIDRDIDAEMERTAGRPLVTGELQPTEALVFAVGIEVVAVVFLAVAVNLLAAGLALAACLFYVFVYTLGLKRTSKQNIVIGGAAGAAPALIGWAAVTGSLGWAPWLMFLIVFLWTPPHFWALAIRYKGDYAAASVPMMPVVDGHKKTAFQIVVYSVLVFAATLALWPVADLGWIYGGLSIFIGVWFIYGAVDLWREDDEAALDKKAIRYFAFSITHLTVVFAAMALDVLLL